jgi:hypothetical protein
VADDIDDDKGDDIDEALEETFPASDPPANTVETGIGVDGGDASTPRTRRPDSSTASVRPVLPTR